MEQNFTHLHSKGMPLPVQHWYRAPERLTSQGEVRGILELTLQEKLTSSGEVRGIIELL